MLSLYNFSKMKTTWRSRVCPTEYLISEITLRTSFKFGLSDLRCKVSSEFNFASFEVFTAMKMQLVVGYQHWRSMLPPSSG